MLVFVWPKLTFLSFKTFLFLHRFSDSELGGVTIAYVRKPDLYRELNLMNDSAVFSTLELTTFNDFE
jgi:hypothetical protein